MGRGVWGKHKDVDWGLLGKCIYQHGLTALKNPALPELLPTTASFMSCQVMSHSCLTVKFSWLST